MANVEDIKFYQAQKVTTCSDGTWILVICCNPFIWHIKAEKGIFKADFQKVGSDSYISDFQTNFYHKIAQSRTNIANSKFNLNIRQVPLHHVGY